MIDIQDKGIIEFTKYLLKDANDQPDYVNKNY